jgi:hypothetical protein
MLEHALAYARAGLPVIPLGVRGKVPACSRGKDDATTDPDVITAWWQENARYNIGVRPPSGVIVLDIDPRNGGTVEQLGAIPETWCARTGGKGLHLWFRYREPVRGALDGATGVDIKSSGGYLVMPPSVHPSGRRYEWTNTARIAWLPPHLRPRVGRPKSSRRTSVVPTSSDAWVTGLVKTVAEAVEGNRNQALYWATCRAFDRGGDSAVLAILRAAGTTAGLCETEVERTMSSAERRRA